MEEEKRTYGLLPIIGSSHVYQVGKVKFHVASYFTGTATIEEQFAEADDSAGASRRILNI